MALAFCAEPKAPPLIGGHASPSYAACVHDVQRPPFGTSWMRSALSVMSLPCFCLLPWTFVTAGEQRRPYRRLRRRVLRHALPRESPGASVRRGVPAEQLGLTLPLVTKSRLQRNATQCGSSSADCSIVGNGAKMGSTRRNFIGVVGLTCPMSKAAVAVNGAVATSNELLEANPVMKKFALQFRDSQQRLEGGADTKAVGETLAVVLEFFSSNVWKEIESIGAREKEIWGSLYVSSSDTASMKPADVQFLMDYYAFWSSFNSLFDALLLRMSPSLPRFRENLKPPAIQEVVDADKNERTFGGKVALLPDLFSEIVVNRVTRKGAAGSRGSAVAIVRTYCQGGQYMDGLGKLIDAQVELLGGLQAIEDGKSPKESAVLKALGAVPQAELSAEDVKAKIIRLLYDLQGVFLFVNKFQADVVKKLA